MRWQTCPLGPQSGTPLLQGSTRKAARRLLLSVQRIPRDPARRRNVAVGRARIACWFGPAGLGALPLAPMRPSVGETQHRQVASSVDEVLDVHQGLTVEGRDSARDAVDEAVELVVGDGAIDVLVSRVGAVENMCSPPWPPWPPTRRTSTRHNPTITSKHLGPSAPRCRAVAMASDERSFCCVVLVLPGTRGAQPARRDRFLLPSMTLHPARAIVVIETLPTS